MKYRAPLIGITCEAVSRTRDYQEYNLVCDHRYASAIRNAGGHPVLLPIAHRRSVLHRYLEGIDGLVIVGGDDVDPKLYDEEPARHTRVVFSKRTDFEAWLFKEGKRRELPMLGICYGMQFINVMEGGSLYQSIPRRKKSVRVLHRSRAVREHGIHLTRGTRLRKVLGLAQTQVSTEHHQAVRVLAPGYVTAALADDGTIEAIENPGRQEILAVQWHPERTPDSRATRRLFQWFVKTCREARGTKKR